MKLPIMGFDIMISEIYKTLVEFIETGKFIIIGPDYYCTVRLLVSPLRLIFSSCIHVHVVIEFLICSCYVLVDGQFKIYQ